MLCNIIDFLCCMLFLAIKHCYRLAIMTKNSGKNECVLEILYIMVFPRIPKKVYEWVN